MRNAAVKVPFNLFAFLTLGVKNFMVVDSVVNDK